MKTSNELHVIGLVQKLADMVEHKKGEEDWCEIGQPGMDMSTGLSMTRGCSCGRDASVKKLLSEIQHKILE